MPASRAATWAIESNRGRGVWEVLCRAALRGADVAARVLGLDAIETRVERAELLVSYGVTPPPPASAMRRLDADRAIDWARLSEFERGRVAREMNGGMWP